MTDFLRPADKHFAALDDFPYAPRDHAWQDLRMRYVDEGPRDAPVMLMLHGMPTWSYLYRKMIPGLLAAGYRCIAPDHFGFGRSDKPTDLHWYTIARHTEVLTTLITALDLRRVTLIVQDWGGPIGLAQAALMPDRIERLVIMNTWLHHPGYEYSPAIHNWNRNWHDGGLFYRERPEMALLLVMAAGRAPRELVLPALVSGNVPAFDGEAARVYRAYSAPYRDLPDAAFNGYRRFPRSIPLDSPDNGNAVMQTHTYRQLLGWSKPTHFIWGGADDIFPTSWGREWAARMNASFDLLPDAGHFLQETHGEEIARLLLARIAEER